MEVTGMDRKDTFQVMNCSCLEVTAVYAWAVRSPRAHQSENPVHP